MITKADLERARLCLRNQSPSYVQDAHHFAQIILDNEGLLLPGWYCEHCGVFNGTMKESRNECRSCGKDQSIAV